MQESSNGWGWPRCRICCSTSPALRGPHPGVAHRRSAARPARRRRGEIQDTQLVMGRRRMLVCRISDGTGTLTLRFFNFTAAQKNSLSPGRLMRCFGEVRPGKYGLEMAHPSTSCSARSRPARPKRRSPRLPDHRGAAPAHPAQPHRSGAGPARPLRGRRAVARRSLPQQIDLAAALKLLHRPPPRWRWPCSKAASTRPSSGWCWRSCWPTTSVLKVRAQAQTQLARALKPAPALVEQLLGALPFTPTGAQNRVVAEIGRDLQQSHPMMRLVQGTWAPARRWSQRWPPCRPSATVVRWA